MRRTPASLIRAIQTAGEGSLDGGLRQTKTFTGLAMASKNGTKRTWTKPQAAQVKRTHFVCFPLTTDESIPQLQRSLARFRQVTTQVQVGNSKQGLGASRADVNRASLPGTGTPRAPGQDSALQVGEQPHSVAPNHGFRQIPPEAHRPPGTFHLTLGVMDLSQTEDMERALRLLEELDYLDLLRRAEAAVDRPRRGSRVKSEADPAQSPANDDGTRETSTARAAHPPLKSLSRAISPPATRPGPEAEPGMPAPLSLMLHGLGTFPSARSARVFFAHADEPTRRLQRFAELVQQQFRDAGLVTETRPLVLHATVANLIYVKGSRRGRGGGKPGRGGEIDATQILEFFNDDSSNDTDLPGRQVSGTLGDDASVPAHYRERLEGTSERASNVAAAPELDGTLHRTPSSFGAAKRKSNPHGYIWARDIFLDRVRICKMGAETCDIPHWGLEYKPVGEKIFFPPCAA